MGKTKIAGELGEEMLLLPELLCDALAANDRAKYLMALLQNAKNRADAPQLGIVDLKAERLASGISDGSLDDVIAQSAKESPDHYWIPSVQHICGLLVDSVGQMLAPLRVRDGGALAGSGPGESEYRNRLTNLAANLLVDSNDRITGSCIDRITSAARDGADSLHLLVMDLHKELNRIHAQIASESIAGAHVFGLDASDRALVAAFMDGVNQTKALKFDHPGLETTATRAGGKLVIQNDLGTTDAHVLIVHVSPPQAVLIHTDVHMQRLLFFQNMLTPLGVQWEGTHSQDAARLTKTSYYSCRGTFVAADLPALESALRLLGSRLVFLIDWNRARKQLQKFAPRDVAVNVLNWAAEQNYGHRGFLQLGGEQLLADALQTAGRGTLPAGQKLADLLGPERTTDCLEFALKTSTEGLLSGRSDFIIRDEIAAELRRCVDLACPGYLGAIAEHATLIVELAMAVRDGILRCGGHSDQAYLRRMAERAKKWEHAADELVKKGRSARLRGDLDETLAELLAITDNVADELEEAVFLLTLLPASSAVADSLRPLHELAGFAVQGAQEYLKAVENARCLRRGSSRQQIHDFLEAVDAAVTVEHRADDAHRRAQAGVVTFAGDFKELHLFAKIADALEAAADSLMRSAYVLRSYVMIETLTG